VSLILPVLAIKLQILVFLIPTLLICLSSQDFIFIVEDYCSYS
jgi:hypothetical protein